MVLSNSFYAFMLPTGEIIALDGSDGMHGNRIWNIPTMNEVFVLNCGNIDINKDGHGDCLGAGRRGIKR